MTASPTDRLFDPIAMEVFSNRLLSITEDMGNSLVRSSFSTNIKERRDCSVGLFDARGRLVAQAAHIPLHLGSLLGGVLAVLARYPVERMRDGDAFICNDPYLAGGTHMPDVSVVTPVFWDGQVRFFTANIGHHSDFGGAVPGSIAGSARSVFEEGLRLPVIRIRRAGEIDDDLLNLIVQNTREPEERELDLRVQVATNDRGADEVRGLLKQMGLGVVETAIEDILAYTARRLRRRIAELKEGSYTFTTFLDDDGFGGGDPVPLKATVRIEGGHLALDFTGTGAQARGALNVPPSALHATVHYCIKALLDPQLMPNSGMLDVVSIHVPEGTILSPRHAAAVGARSITCQKVAGAIFGAFRGVLPEAKVMASAVDVIPAMVFSGALTRRNGTYVYLETIGGGCGARRDEDGMDAIHMHMTNTSNLPAEALENEYPLLVDEYAMVEDSGGVGAARGGMGIARQIRALRDGTVFSVRSDSHNRGTAGVNGGGDGRHGRLVRNPGRPDEQELGSKVSHLILAAGEAIRIETPGGGGFGPPAARPLEKLAIDLRDSILSYDAAVAGYGRERVELAVQTLASPFGGGHRTEGKIDGEGRTL